MNSKILIAVLAVGWAVSPGAVAADPDIQVHASGSGSYLITLSSAAITNMPAAQAAMMPIAQKSCGGKVPQFGHYKFTGSAPVAAPAADQKAQTSFTIDQDITCVDSVPQVVKAAPADPNWRPSGADYQAVIDTVTRYFNAKDSGDVTASYALLDGGMGLSAKEWKSTSDDFAATTGRPVSHKVLKLTWYKDPQDAPAPGVYAATDFVDHYEKVTNCGYLSMHQQSDGSFRVIHEQDGFLPNGSDIAPAKLAELENKLGCLEDVSEPLSEAKGDVIGYPDVATARKELLARKDADSHTEGGWLIVEVPAEHTAWSFAPETDPAYPAAVKRVVTQDASGVYISMQVLCEASKIACDNLVRQFQDLNARIKASLSQH